MSGRLEEDLDDLSYALPTGALDEINDGVAALRALVDIADKAPHEPGCRWDRIDALAYRGPIANCTCWKAEYDAAKEAAK